MHAPNLTVPPVPQSVAAVLQKCIPGIVMVLVTPPY